MCFLNLVALIQNCDSNTSARCFWHLASDFWIFHDAFCVESTPGQPRYERKTGVVSGVVRAFKSFAFHGSKVIRVVLFKL